MEDKKLTTEEWRERFESTARKYIHRTGVDELLDAIRKTDFYTAPASIKYHEAYEHGLVEHTLKVCDQLIKDASIYPEPLDVESLVIISLFHDLCKIGYYTMDTRNVKNEQGVWEKVPYYKVEDLFPMGHGEKSLYMVSQFMSLSDEEALAIRWHMGGYEPKENYQYLSNAYRQDPYAVLLHCADLKATYLQ